MTPEPDQLGKVKLPGHPLHGTLVQVMAVGEPDGDYVLLTVKLMDDWGGLEKGSRYQLGAYAFDPNIT